MDLFPDLHLLTDEELDAQLQALEQEEHACSLHRKMLHGRIDLLRPVLVERLRDELAAGRLPTPASEPGRQIFTGEGLDSGEDNDDLGPMPDVSAMSTDEVRQAIRDLERHEDDVSLRRRFLQGKIDILRAERARRSRGGPDLDPEHLERILGGLD